METLSITSLLKKLLAVQKELKPVAKNGYNDYHKYAYVREEDLLNALRPLLNEHGLVITCRGVINHEQNGPISTVFMGYVVHDVDSGEFAEFIAMGQGEDKSDKGSYKAMTGASKYFLSKFFNISVGDDPEGSAEAVKGKRVKDASVAPVSKTTLTEISNVAKEAGGSIEELQEWVAKTFDGRTMLELTEGEAKKVVALLQKKAKAKKLMDKQDQ